MIIGSPNWRCPDSDDSGQENSGNYRNAANFHIMDISAIYVRITQRKIARTDNTKNFRAFKLDIINCEICTSVFDTILILTCFIASNSSLIVSVIFTSISSENLHHRFQLIFLHIGKFIWFHFDQQDLDMIISCFTIMLASTEDDNFLPLDSDLNQIYY